MEEQLVSLIRAQKKEAIELLYDNYSSALYGIVVRIVRSSELAQDVMQDTFVKAWKNGPSYDPTKGRLFTWLLNIARNTAIDATRSSAFKMGDKTGGLDSLVSLGSPSINPDHVGLRKLVGKLDPKYRTLVELIYFQGYTQQEVEKELNIPIGTIKTRLRAAVGELRKVFGETGLPGVLLMIASLEKLLN